MTPCIGYITRIVIALLATGFGLKAQMPFPKYNFRHLNIQNGLSQNVVYHFLQDSRGYMWIGTHNGVTLYDGISTTNFVQNENNPSSITGNFISSILEDSTQQVWIGNESGIDRYNRLDHSFTHYGVDRPDGTKDNTYCVLLGFVSAKALWFLDTKTKSIRELNLETGRTSFIGELQANHANLYKGSGNKIYVWAVYDKGTIHQTYLQNKLINQKKYFVGDANSRANPGFGVTHVLQQNDSTAWLSTTEGLVKLNPESGRYHLFNRWKGQPVREIRYSAISPKGQLWLGSGPSGVYIFDLKTNQFINNLKNDKVDPLSVCSDNIVSLYFDKTGNVWCGSFGNGSSYASTETAFFTSHLPATEMKAVNGINAISWVGADNNNQFWCLIADLPGFWILDENFNLREHKTPRSQDGSQYTGPIHKMLFDSAGGIWCGTNKGIYKYDYEKNVLCPIDYELVNTDVFGSAWIREMILLRDHSILFSTFGGVYRITNSNNKPLVTPLKFLKPGSFNGFGQLYQDAGNLVYIKSLSDSLYIFSASPNGDLHLYQALNFKPDINNFFSDRTDSLVFLATTDGVYYISRNNFQIRKASFSSKLPFLNICNGLKQEGRFWLFGQRGLYFFDEKTEQGRMYTIEDGLPANEFSLSPIVYSSNKKCIAGSSNGLVSFFPNQKQDSIYPPRPSITKVFVNDIAYASSNNPNEFEQLRLSHIQNTFSFHFAPIAFQHTAQSSFEFMLEGYDETWIKTNTANYTRYSKIPPGKYLLRLRALDAMGRVSPFSKVLEIEIAKAFWQTSVFRVFVVVFLGLMGWLLAKSYFKRRMIKQKLEFEKQQAIERERTRIATDMHDDLGAGLSRIKFLSQALSNKTTEDDSLKTGLEKIIGFSDEMTEKMGEIVWALNEKNDTLADLVAYTRSYAMEYLANHNISCDMNTPNNLPGSFIPGEVRRNIFLTVKECLHNIIKHSEATKVDFVIELNHRIEITIHDNGKGIDWNNRRAFSNGLQNIDKRMNEIHGKAIFLNDNGTRVILNIPLTV